MNKTCEYCGKEFEVPARNAHIARFCSDECRDRDKGHMPIGDYKELLNEQKEETAERNERQRIIKKMYQLLKKKSMQEKKK